MLQQGVNRLALLHSLSAAHSTARIFVAARIDHVRAEVRDGLRARSGGADLAGHAGGSKVESRDRN